jgi:hypothetical protein
MTCGVAFSVYKTLKILRVNITTYHLSGWEKSMEKPKNNLIDFLKNQIVVENEIVDSLEKALVGMKNPAVKGG